MAYHFDSFTKEPVRCTFAYGSCPVAPAGFHYGNISEAVRERTIALTQNPLTLHATR